MTTSSYDAQIASIDAQIKRLCARRRDEVARREQSERKAYNHACHALGEMVMGDAGMTWQELDYAELDELMKAELPAARARLATAADTTTREATRRLRAWEHARQKPQPSLEDSVASETFEEL